MSAKSGSSRNRRSKNKKELDRYNKELLEKVKGIEDVLQTLRNDGANLWKVRSTSKWFRRKYMLNVGDMSLHYEPSYKNRGFPCFGTDKTEIDIAEITDVRKGWKTDTFNKIGVMQDKKSKESATRLSVDESSCFSIVYSDVKQKDRTLDLVAPNPEIAEKWVKAILHLVNWTESKKQEEGYELWLRKKFNYADVDNNKCLTFSETMRLIRELNIQMTDAQAKKLFEEANTRRAGHRELEVLDEDEFISFYFRLLQRPEIEELFSSYARSTGILTVNELCQFLQKEQSGHEAVSIDDCNELINLHEQSDLKKRGQMTTSGFINMLLSSEFDVFNKRQRRVYQDMTQPLAHYYIASSHNTYLLGNQLSSKSSVEGYLDALKRGCRCVELDLWDGEDEEPIVWHGHTFTSKLPLREVLEDAIKPYAFAASSYPLILSLENHCSPIYQLKVASYFRSILGEMLYTEDVTEDMEALPSPKELKRKIILKAKKSHGHGSKTVFYASHNDSAILPIHEDLKSSALKETRESRVAVSVQMHNNTNTSESDGVTRVSTSTSTTKQVVTSSSRLYAEASELVAALASEETLNSELEESESESEETSSDEEPETGVDFIDAAGHAAKSKPTDALSALVNLVQAVKFHSFVESRESAKCYQMSSFGESKAMKLIEKQGRAFVDYNKRQLSRIYPGGARTGSSNFDPIQFWTVGCQIVALNYQTEDQANFINSAWFRDNGNCGYILKPEFLRNPHTQFDPNWLLDKNQGKILKIRIVSGQHLPKAPGNSEVVDPYIEIRITGLAQDTEYFKTKTVHNNGFNPIWNETFETRVRCPELAVLGLCVRDYAQTSADMPLAHYAIPFNAIATGYRHIHLQSLKGVPLTPSSLFVHLTLEAVAKSF